MKTSYNIVLSEQTLTAIVQYKADIIAGKKVPGAKLKKQMNDLPQMATERFIEALLATKSPKIFAESEITGDGSDWNHTELALLGDINITMPAKIYDNGVWSPSDMNFREYKTPLEGHLLFTPGALLKGAATDLAEVTEQEKIDQEKYNRLVERRLLPLLAHADTSAKHAGKHAFIILPGIGCGEFAGAFKGQMGEHLNVALQALLDKHGKKFTHIACVYFDPFGECKNAQKDIHNIKYRVRPAAQNPGKSQLLPPQAHQETGDDFSNCTLYKIVAWDHVSFPGNDFFVNSRTTDDGVSAAATNSMESVTGIKGEYARGQYNPPEGYKNWEQVVLQNNIRLIADQNVNVTLADGAYLELSQYEKNTVAPKLQNFKPS